MKKGLAIWQDLFLWQEFKFHPHNYYEKGREYYIIIENKKCNTVNIVLHFFTFVGTLFENILGIYTLKN